MHPRYRSRASREVAPKTKHSIYFVISSLTAAHILPVCDDARARSAFVPAARGATALSGIGDMGPV
eukprot:4974636-Pyramimonas_sp.AAC.1